MGIFSFLNNKPQEVERNRFGEMFYTLFGGKASYGSVSDSNKLDYMLKNPALGKVVFLNCDVFSLAQIKRIDGKEDELTKLLKNPNKFQTQRQFLWTYRFWLMFGTSYLKTYSNSINSSKQALYWLNPTNIIWKNEVLKKLSRIVYSDREYKKIMDSTIEYSFGYGNGKALYKLREIKPFHDLANSFGNWFKGNSRIDALWKILNNSDSALDSKSINLKFSRKFIVSGSYDPTKNLESLSGMEDIEKEDLQSKMMSDQPIHPVKSQVNIERFVKDLAKLKLDDSYNEDLAKVGSIYNIPADVLEALKKGSTYENKEKSLGQHISYSEMPKAKDFLEGLCQVFSLSPDDYEITFNDNSFMQVFEKEKAGVNKIKAETFKLYSELGADKKEIAEMLGIDLEFKNSNNESDS